MQEIMDTESAQEFVEYITEDKPDYKTEKVTDGHIVTTPEVTVFIPSEYSHVLDKIRPKSSEYSNDLIYGKDKTEGIISSEIKDDKLHLYKQDGSVEVRNMAFWILTNKRIDKHCTPLIGKQKYKFIRLFNTKKAKSDFYNKNKRRADLMTIWNDLEAALIYYGITEFKGLKNEEVTTLSFDIEADGLVKDETSKVYLITNTLKNSDGSWTRKHFRLDEYESDVEMIEDWCDWVRKVDPTVLVGHNIFGYDLPYLYHCCMKRDGELYPMNLGKDDSAIVFNKKSSEKRVDGNTSWTYHKCNIFGRHIIDTMFMSVSYDIGRNYPTWGLKPIINYEYTKVQCKSELKWTNWDRKMYDSQQGRQFYDASKVGKNWSNPVEREKIVQYGINDSDDSLLLYELQSPSLFYMTQSVPKPYQLMGLSASGSQLNAVMVRSYLQKGHSIPKTSEYSYVAGGISYGVPGVYRNVVKFDAKSYYPSTILAFDICDKTKDPEGHYLEMVRHFTHQRFDQKRKHKETGEKYYDDLQAASKIFINSAYGLFGTQGLNFNNFEKANLITKCCRKGLEKAVEWATNVPLSEWWAEYSEKETASQDFSDCSFIDTKAKVKESEMRNYDFQLVNVDTDALSFCKKDGTEYTEEEYEKIQSELNDIMYCDWEEDGVFTDFLVSKAKNYVMREKGSTKLKYKGSSLTDSKKERALLEMLQEVVVDLIDNDGKEVINVYHQYIRESQEIDDIMRWTTKVSVTDSVLKATTTRAQKVLDALKNVEYKEGDKFWIYPKIDGLKEKVVKGEVVLLADGSPKMIDNKILKVVDFWERDEDKGHYAERVYKAIKTLENVLDMDRIIKYYIKGNKELLEKL